MRETVDSRREATLSGILSDEQALDPYRIIDHDER